MSMGIHRLRLDSPLIVIFYLDKFEWPSSGWNNPWSCYATENLGSLVNWLMPTMMVFHDQFYNYIISVHKVNQLLISFSCLASQCDLMLNNNTNSTGNYGFNICYSPAASLMDFQIDFTVELIMIRLPN